MRKIYVVLVALLCSWQLAVSQCTLTNSTSCTCLGGGTNCDLLPDIKASRYPLTQIGSSGVIEYSQTGNGSNNGLLRISVTTPNIGHGPMETRSTNIFVCGTDTFVGTAPSICPDGITYPKILINQRIYHKNGNTMSYYDRAAGTMTYHPSHGHQHVDDWGVYTLRTQTTDPNPLNWPIVGNGAKLAFCLLDIGPCTSGTLCIADNGDTLNTSAEFYGNYALGGGSYGCSTTLQGISVGYYDTYVQSLDGMYIVIPPGTCNGNYYIVCQQDPYNYFLEENDNNNVIAVPFTLTKQAGTVPVVTGSGATTFCTGGSVTLTSTAATSYLWSNGATTQSITVNQSGTYSCTVDGTTACPATSNAVTVTVNPMSVSAGASSTNICSGQQVALNSSATGAGVGNQTQASTNSTVYNIPDNNATGITSTIAVSGINPSTLVAGAVVSVTVNITHTYTGDLEIRLVSPSGQSILLSNRRGGSGNNFTGTTFSMSASTLISAGSPPFSGSYIPDGNLSSFTGNANGNWQLKVIDLDASDVGTLNNWTFRINTQVPTTMSYVWTSNPSGFNSTSQNPTASPTVSPTTYIVTATESITGCTGSNSVTVNISNPVVTVSPSTAICAGSSATLTANGANSYSWSPSTGLNATTGATVIATPASTTTYIVTGTNTGGCSDSKSVTVTVNPLPNVTANNVSGCAGSSIALAGTPAGGNYSQPNPYTGTSTTYTYTYTDANGCTNTSAPANITVNPLPSATTTPSGTVTTCNPTQLISANTGAGLSYQWKFNGNNISGATSSTYTAGASGSYSVVVTNSNNCSSTSTSVAISVSTGTPAITASGSTTICEGTAVTLNATAGGTSYQWYKNNSAQAGATSASYAVSSAGNYYCAITTTGCSGNSNSIAITVINNPAPVLTYNTPLTFCSPGSVALISNAYAGVTYQWQKNSIDIAGATNQLYTASTSGKYRVKQTANGCTKQGMDVTVSAGASSVTSAITANGPTSFCNGSSVTLDVTNPIPGYSLQWQNNGTNIGGATNASYVATVSGNYTCVVSASCGNATSNTISVSAGSISAVVTPSGSVNICSGAIAALTANAGAGYNYQWQLNGVNINGATSQTYNASAAGNYSVAINSPCGNTTSAATTVNVTALSISVTPVLTTVCEGSAATFTASSGLNYIYQWFRNGAAVAGATNSTFATSQGANYTVMVIQGGACTATSNQSTLNVINNPKPTITPGGPTTFCAGGSVTLTANTFTGVAYQWQKGSVNIAGATNQSYVASTTGNYRVLETANGCTKTATPIAVTVNCKTQNENSNEITVNDVTASPNPTSGNINLQVNSIGSEKLVMRLFNVLGKEVLTVVAINKKGENIHTLDLSYLVKGVYLLKVEGENQNKTIKVVLE